MLSMQMSHAFLESAVQADVLDLTDPALKRTGMMGPGIPGRLTPQKLSPLPLIVSILSCQRRGNKTIAISLAIRNNGEEPFRFPRSMDQLQTYKTGNHDRRELIISATAYSPPTTSTPPSTVIAVVLASKEDLRSYSILAPGATIVLKTNFRTTELPLPSNAQVGVSIHQCTIEDDAFMIKERSETVQSVNLVEVESTPN